MYLPFANKKEKHITGLISTASVSTVSATTFDFQSKFPCNAPVYLQNEISWVSSSVNEKWVLLVYSGLLSFLLYFEVIVLSIL